MAFSASGLYLPTWIDILDATQLAIDLSSVLHKVALYSNTLTPNFSTDAAYSATNEIAGTAYVAGGKAITGLNPTVTESPTGTLKYTHDPISWAASTITARGGIWYADGLAGNNLIVGVTFGADFVSTAGTFTIQPNALGVFYIDLVP